MGGVAIPGATGTHGVNSLAPGLLACAGWAVAGDFSARIEIAKKLGGKRIAPVGSTVSFPNGDPLFHNVFSLSGARRFDLGYYPQGQTRTVKFDRPGIVQAYCHIHPNMYAAIMVTDSAWYGKPAGDGSFGWRDVPAGGYELLIWHNTAGIVRRTVRVADSGGVELVVRIPAEELER